MDDLISRQAAIDAMATWDWQEVYLPIHFKQLLEELPSAQPEQRWIPVSERLPEDEGWYLVTDDSGGVRWLEVEHYDTEFGLKPFWSVQNPVAWMPLPDPWKGEDDGKG